MGRFVESDGSFYWKWRVVLKKWRVVSCISQEEQKRTRGHLRMKIGEEENWNQEIYVWKNYNNPLSRVRVRAHQQEFYHFCCHKCHSYLCKLLWNSVLLLSFEYVLTVGELMSSKFVIDNWKNDAFLPSFSYIFANFSSHFHLLCDTCDSKKTKLLLEGVRACAYTRAREKTFIPNRTSKRPIKRIWLFCYVCISYFAYRKKKMHFSPIFSLFGAISPHILIGRCEKSVLRSSSFILRRKPIYQIYSLLCLFRHYYFVSTFLSLFSAKKQIEDEGKKGTKEKAASKHGALTRPFRAKRL